MTEIFEKLNTSLDNLEHILEGLKNSKAELESKNAELKSVIDDKDLEILELQENADKAEKARSAAAEEVNAGLEALMARIGKLTAEN